MSGGPPLRICQVVAYDLAEEGGVKRHAMQVGRALRRLGDSVTLIGPRSAPRAASNGHGKAGNGAAGSNGHSPVAGQSGHNGHGPNGNSAGHGASGHGANGVDLDPEVHGFPGVVNIRGNGSDNRIGLFSPPLALRRFFQERQFDVVHVHEPLMPALSYWAVWSSSAAAHVCTFHTYAEEESTFQRLGRKVGGALHLHSFDRAIAVSEPAADFARHAWTRPFALIPNGIPTALFPEAAPRARAPGEPLRLLFVGHFRDARKGLPYLLDAVRLLGQRGIPVSLDVIGSGGPGPLPATPPGVTFHGPISSEAQLGEHYRRCDVFAATATGQESFGIVLLEAMSSGKPIVCSDIIGYRQVVTEEGARFVAPADPVALADAIAGLAGDPAACLRMAAVNRLRSEEFDWDRLAVKVREQYLLAIADHRRRRSRAPRERAAEGS
jgi:phosphatidyl-myo-inositol alpha-mannosyltransferase